MGHFYSPTHTFVDASFLPTVSKADIRSGVGEIMKAALVHDHRLFDLMEARRPPAPPALSRHCPFP